MPGQADTSQHGTIVSLVQPLSHGRGPPMTWICRWWISCPPSSPVFTTTRKPPSGYGLQPCSSASFGASAIMRPNTPACSGGDLCHGRDMQLGHHQEMHWRPRVDVVEGENFFVLINLLGRDLARDDFAEKAVGIRAWEGSEQRESGVQARINPEGASRASEGCPA